MLCVLLCYCCMRGQRAARVFVVRNRVYWARIRGALLMQAAWRGHAFRVQYGEIVDHLTAFRQAAAKLKFFRLIVAKSKVRCRNFCIGLVTVLRKPRVVLLTLTRCIFLYDLTSLPSSAMTFSCGPHTALAMACVGVTRSPHVPSNDMLAHADLLVSDTHMPMPAFPMPHARSTTRRLS
jgi:hypothetical protein